MKEILISPEGKNKLILQGMVHVDHPHVYQRIRKDIELYSSSGYTLIKEGVDTDIQPSDYLVLNDQEKALALFLKFVTNMTSGKMSREKFKSLGPAFQVEEICYEQKDWIVIDATIASISREAVAQGFRIDSDLAKELSRLAFENSHQEFMSALNRHGIHPYKVFRKEDLRHVVVDWRDDLVANGIHAIWRKDRCDILAHYGHDHVEGIKTIMRGLGWKPE